MLVRLPDSVALRRCELHVVGWLARGGAGLSGAPVERRSGAGPGQVRRRPPTGGQRAGPGSPCAYSAAMSAAVMVVSSAVERADGASRSRRAIAVRASSSRLRANRPLPKLGAVRA